MQVTKYITIVILMLPFIGTAQTKTWLSNFNKSTTQGSPQVIPLNPTEYRVYHDLIDSQKNLQKQTEENDKAIYTFKESFKKRHGAENKTLLVNKQYTQVESWEFEISVDDKYVILNKVLTMENR